MRSLATALAAAVLLGSGNLHAAGSFTTPPSIDTQAPVIVEGPTVVSLTDTTAIIRWVTDEIADSRIEYGVGTMNELAADGVKRTEHLVTLTKLAADSVYSYRVLSMDPSGNTASGVSLSFRTLVTPDTTAPALSALAASELTASTARIGWSGSEPATWVLYYSLSGASATQQLAGETPGVAPSAVLTNLLSGRTYAVQIAAWDVAGNATTSQALSFTTLPVPPSPISATTAPGTVTLSWSAVQGATGYAVYCAQQSGVSKLNYASLPQGHVAATTSNVFEHPMAPGDWYVVVTASNASGESLHSEEIAFTIPAVADTVAPSVPQALTATSTGSSSIALAWAASTDNVEVVRYEVYREGSATPIATPGTTAFSDTGLAPATAYRYTVRACDAAGNCSSPSASASATTAAAAGTVGYTPVLTPGWNLLGNSVQSALQVSALFGNRDAPVDGVTASVYSVWKWDAPTQRWAFHSPMLSAADNAAYAERSGFDVLSTIEPGEGYWVNAASALSLPAQTGAPFSVSGDTFAALPGGWNLLALHAETALSPSAFNRAMGGELQPGQIAQSFWSLWQWDSTGERWYFYSPMLEAQGGLAAVKTYAESNSYLDFETVYDGAPGPKRLDPGSGFWVNR